MKRIILYSALFLVALFVWSIFFDLPWLYKAKAIEATVVDADTHQPLEGVIVTANWQLETGTVGGNNPAGELQVFETVTDQQGHFAFPAWGPKIAWGGFLVSEDPKIVLFKPGYEYRALFNQWTADPQQRTRYVRYSEWNGKTIELKKFTGSLKVYANELDDLAIGMYWAYGSCDWKKIPLLVRALDRQAREFQQQGIRTDIHAIDQLIPPPGYPDRCGAKAYFEKNPR